MIAEDSNGRTALKWHPSLKKVFKDCDLWWQNNMVKRDKLELGVAALRAELDTPGLFNPGIGTLQVIGHVYASGACTTEATNNPGVLTKMLRRAVQFRALDLRKLAGLSLPLDHQPLRPFETSMQAAGPTVLSDWALAETCAQILVDVAEKDLRINPVNISPDRWRRGTNDAFLIYLFSDAFGFQTTYQPSLVPEYQALLEAWRSSDEVAFRQAMHGAAEFHISRSRASTSKMTYEFEYNFDRVFPAELLAVLALRRKVGAPDFSVGHLLIDTPWTLIRDMPPAPPPEIVAETEARLRSDCPSFR